TYMYHLSHLLTLLPSTPSSTLFPYTTLFRSARLRTAMEPPWADPVRSRAQSVPTTAWPVHRPEELVVRRRLRRCLRQDIRHPGRSEEHTSELQSHLNLVCRLLLEKKKHHTNQ